METIDHGGGAHDIHKIPSADMITNILCRLPGDSVVRCRHVCKTWRALIDDPSRRIWMITFPSADITINILSRLPADSIIECCRCVCKAWRALVNDPSFVDAHTYQLVASSSSSSTHHHHKGGKSSSFNFFVISHFNKSGNCRFGLVEYYNVFSPLKVKTQTITHHPIPLNFGNVYHNFMGSCNGLVFLGSALPSDDGFFVCNPLTREYINILMCPTQQKEDGFLAYGFGYLPCTNEYKVVSIHYKSFPSFGQISVYTLGSGRWRNIGETQYQLFWNRRPGLLANGALHWMKRNRREIISFNLADEEFRIVPSPPSMSSPQQITVDKLSVLEGCLCMTRREATRSEIWVLNHHDNVNLEDYSRLWSKMEFSMPSNSYEPHVILKDGKVLLSNRKGLVSYDPNTKHLKKYDVSSEWFDIIPYTASFVSLKSLGKEDAKSFEYPCYEG